jgi:Fuc2NAc and GlcNAc transferase
LVGGGIFVAVIGLADDHRHLSRSWRLLGHLAAAAWAVVWLGALPPLPVFGVTLDFGPAGQLLAALYVAWVLNLTNFMDGIDGIAAVETVTVTLGGALLYAIAIPGARDWTTLLAVGAATLGFLVWNWPPARIFMGDVGSGFLGFVLAMFSLQAGLSKAELFWGWVILLGVFVADATVTLIRRALRGERFYESHRTHAYQHAATRCGAHRPVTLAVAVINLAWLLPIAALVARGSLDGAAGALIAYTPLVACALWFDAGVDRPSIRHAAERQVV